MSEMDLVPVHYRRAARSRRWLRAIACVEGALLLSLVVAKLGLAYGEMTLRKEIAALQAAEQLASERRTVLSGLEHSRQQAEQRLTILDGLRGSVSIDSVFGAVDAALDEGIWFLDWTFRRAGQLVDDNPKAVQTGYFLVVPLETENGSADGRAWRLETHMEVRGQALDHSTLARFVGRLLDEPRIQQVRIVNTQVQQLAAAEVVDFELAVVVRTGA